MDGPGIYQLTFPDHRYYIGSSQHVSTRLKSHAYELRRGKHSNANLQAAFDAHGPPVESLLLACDVEDLIWFEQVLMDTMDPALNISRTAGRVEMTAEVRTKISVALRGRKVDPEVVERRASLLRGKKRSQAFVDKITGRKNSSETLALMRASAKSSWTPERKAAASERVKALWASGNFGGDKRAGT